MFKIKYSIFVFFILTILLQAQVVQDFKMQPLNPDRNGLVGNGITDLVWSAGKLIARTGYGLSLTGDLGENWQNYTPGNYRGKGGVSALAVAPDNTIWIATGYDTTVQEDETLDIGGGLRYLSPGSSEWVFIPQPVDARTDPMGGMKPTTTRVQNITYDIAILDTQIWITSFGGGVRRSLDQGQTWEIITTDGKPFDVLNQVYGLNHRGFSAMVENGNIWVGTCIALAHNPWNNSTWAVTLSTGGEEFNSISMTLDGGRTWQNFLKDELSDGTFARSIAFYDSAVYVATEKGVYKSIDDGRTWFEFPAIIDKVSGEQLHTNKFYSVATSPSGNGRHRLWAGSADGLATTDNNGYNWTIFRSFVSTLERQNPPVYAYPTPFSPERETILRFQYDVTQAGEVSIDIFNFAMEKVITIRKQEFAPTQNSFDRSATWDGRDNNGRMVDNGVYFFRAKVEGKVSWGKIVVIN
ncbi:MAG: hypothetical protein P8Y60_19905 [Calditrichota bacterium]